MANTIKESKGVASQRDILTKRRCPTCNKLMRQNEISVEMIFNHTKVVGKSRVNRVLKHTKNCSK